MSHVALGSGIIFTKSDFSQLKLSVRDLYRFFCCRYVMSCCDLYI